jgi:SAM-dependent methyltransferase
MAGTGADLVGRARVHWTKERVAKVTGGKRFLLKPDEAPELLHAIGLLSADATMPADCLRKYSQINHMLALLQPVLDDLAARHKVVRVIDAGCGNSYLTFLLAWYLHVHTRHDCRIVGIDSNPKVVESSRARAAKLGLDGCLRFDVSRIDALAWERSFRQLFPEDCPEADDEFPRPHLVVALHACDTATDSALGLGIGASADVLAVAPCCHAELAKLWSGMDGPVHPFRPVFASANLRRDAAAVMTDALRMLLVRRCGYEVTATEFVPSDHTPKNRLLLCIRRGRYLREAGEQYERLKESLGGAAITLETLVPGA